MIKWLHLPFDEQKGSEVPDISGHGRDAKLVGAARIVDDETFGRCLELAGGCAMLAPLLPSNFDIMSGLTVLMWVKHGKRGGELGTGNLLTWSTFGAALTSHCYGLEFAVDLESNPAQTDEVYLSFFPSLAGVPIAADRWVPVALKWRFTGRDGDIPFELHGMTHELGVGDKPSNYSSVGSTDGPMYSLLQGLEVALKTSSPADIDDMKKYWAAGPDCPVLGYTPAASAASADESPWGRTQAELAARLPKDSMQFRRFPAEDEQTPAWLRRKEAQSRGFQGRIAQLRIYGYMLSDEEIMEIHKSDIPFALQLRNEDDESTFYIDSNSRGQTMLLNLIHDVAKPFQLVEAATADDWHFCLGFPSGTLNQLKAIQVDTAGWYLVKEQSAQGDMLKLFADAGNTNVPSKIVLNGFAIVPVAGRRDVSIQMHYQGLKRKEANSVLQGTTRQSLRISDRRGYRTLPLRAYLVGVDHVVIGQANTLKAHITNTHADYQKADHSEKIEFSSDATLVVSFDDRDGTDWALAEHGAIANMGVRIAAGVVSDTTPTLAPEPTVPGRPNQWRFPLRGITLAPRQHLEIALSGIPASGHPGLSKVYFDLVDVAGYRSARYACGIEKRAPISARPAWQALDVDTAFWSVDFYNPPEYFKDPGGVVHLRGKCTLWSNPLKDNMSSRDDSSNAESAQRVRHRWRDFVAPAVSGMRPKPPGNIGLSGAGESNSFSQNEAPGWLFEEPIPAPFKVPAHCAPGKPLCFSRSAVFREFFSDALSDCVEMAGTAVLAGRDFAIKLRGDERSYLGQKYAERMEILIESKDESRYWRSAWSDVSQPWFGPSMHAFGMGWWRLDVDLTGLSYLAEASL